MSLDDYQPLFQQYGRASGIDPDLLHALAYVESRGNPKALSPAGAGGLMQIMPATAKALGVDPYKPDQAVKGAATLMAQNLDRYGDIDHAILAYHGGTNQKLWGPKTRKYLQDVKAAYGKSTVAGADPADDLGSVLTGGAGGDDLASVLTGQKSQAKADPFDAVFGDAPTTASPAAPGQPAAAPASMPSPQSDAFDKAFGDVPARGGSTSDPVKVAALPPLPWSNQQAYDAARRYQQSDDYNAGYAPQGTKQGPPPTRAQAAEAGLNDAWKTFAASIGHPLTEAEIAARKDPNTNSLLTAMGLSPVTSAEDLHHLSDMRFQHAQRELHLGDNDAYRASQFAGNVAITAPAITAGGEVLAAAKGLPVLARLAEAARAAKATNQFTQVAGDLASRAASGAYQGAAASGLNSSMSDTPVGDQMAEGGVLGAGLNVAIPYGGKLLKGVAGVASRAAEPFTQGGREQIVNRLIDRLARGGPTDINASELIAGSRPTLAQATANPGIAAAERAVRDIRPNPFVERAAASQSAREGALESVTGDAHTVADLAASRDAQTTPLRASAFSNSGAGDASPVVSAIDSVLASPTGKLDEVSGPLKSIRDKLHLDDAGMTPASRSELDAAIMKSVGSDAAAVSPAAMQEAKERIGGAFNDVGARTSIKIDDALLSHLGEIGHDASQVLTEGELKPLLSQIENIGSVGAGAEMSGEAYQSLTRRGAPLDRAMSSANPNIAYYARQIRDGLDDALERSVAPEDKAALQQARTQYRNLKMVQGALDKTRPGDPVDPSALLAQVRKAYPNYSFTGGGDLGAAAEGGLKAAARPASLESDPQQLYGVRASLDNLIQARSAKLGPNDEAVTALRGVRDRLDESINQAAPGYKNYLQVFGERSRPIDEQNYLQSLNLTDARGSITLGKVDSAIKRIELAQSQPADSAAKGVSEDAVDRLRAIRADLRREGNSSLGKSIGSNTFQNLATNNLMATMGIPGAAAATAIAHHPLVAPLMLGGKLLYSSQNDAITDQLVNRLLNPDQLSGSLQQQAGRKLIPAPAGQVLNCSYVPALLRLAQPQLDANPAQ